ncbi:flagellin lysine-N-methylase [Oceanirhabdus seepicola]|uniref:Flagellin lysine-N-methylase n=1 Tax=Oceanirhabdus seepicola TaxID=2828781 RepID=A0A9J6NYE4_9CLOT|nr:flagellin lysine-N-methylase [Oceanirhabdus seepicola]MCM1988160.1 flagellin lysine-N-methylase [Oceanirhabdus seepicola]
MIENKEVFIPKYMKSFKCIGPNCEDTCCAGWSIPIDQETYMKYTNLMEKENNIFKGKLQLVNNESNMNYARTLTKNHDKCTFLNEKNLCDIQCQYGEDLLSSTCYHYPRVYNIVDGIYEKSAKLSCPEAARLILLQRDGFDFLEDEEEIKDNFNIKRIFDSLEYEIESIESSFFWEIRSSIINIFNTPKENIHINISISRWFISQVKSKWDKNHDIYEIEKIIEEIKDSNIENKKYELLTNELKYIEYEKIISFLSELSNHTATNLKLKGKIDEILKEKCDIENYENNLEKAEYDYIYRNLIINSIFMSLYPLNSHSNILIGLDKILEKYYLFKSIFSLYKGKELENEIIEFIQVFYKSYEHNIEFNKFYEKKISKVV